MVLRIANPSVCDRMLGPVSEIGAPEVVEAGALFSATCPKSTNAAIGIKLVSLETLKQHTPLDTGAFSSRVSRLSELS